MEKRGVFKSSNLLIISVKSDFLSLISIFNRLQLVFKWHFMFKLVPNSHLYAYLQDPTHQVCSRFNISLIKYNPSFILTIIQNAYSDWLRILLKPVFQHESRLLYYYHSHIIIMLFITFYHLYFICFCIAITI